MADGAKIAQTVFSGINSALGGGWIQGIMQKRENQRQRDYEQDFYQTQKQDNLDFWRMENQYNSPEMQMQRLKQAGLNPNLVYGNGATAQGGQISSPSQTASNSTKTADIRPQIMLDLYDLKVKDAQANLLNQQAETQKTQREVNAVQAELKRLEQIRLRTSNEYDRKTLDQRIETISAQYQQILTQMSNTRSQTRRTDTENQIAIESNNRARQLQPYTIQDVKSRIQNTNAGTQEKLQNIITSRTTADKNLSETQKIQAEKLLLELDAVMKSQGISPNSSGVSRILDRIMAGISNPKDFEQTIKQAKEAIKSLKK